MRRPEEDRSKAHNASQDRAASFNLINDGCLRHRRHGHMLKTVTRYGMPAAQDLLGDSRSLIASTTIGIEPPRGQKERGLDVQVVESLQHGRRRSWFRAVIEREMNTTVVRGPHNHARSIGWTRQARVLRKRGVRVCSNGSNTEERSNQSCANGWYLAARRHVHGA